MVAGPRLTAEDRTKVDAARAEWLRALSSPEALARRAEFEAKRQAEYDAAYDAAYAVDTASIYGEEQAHEDAAAAVTTDAAAAATDAAAAARDAAQPM